MSSDLDGARPIHSAADAVAKRAKADLPETLRLLRDYLSYPAISCERERAGDVARLAHRVRDDLEALGLQDAKVLHLEGALPCVIAEHRGAGPERPTLLIYGHLDLQPVNEPEWESPAHEAVERDGRLYARGAADDMGGWVSHMGAIAAWLREADTLPINLKLFIEGEEEIGSPNLERYMDAFPEAFAADVMVLTDCENPSTEIPGLTVSLRGLLEIEVRCDSLKSDVHSGLWGNLVPDPAIALLLLIARIVDEDGRLKLGRVEVDEEWRQAAHAIPLGPEVVREAARLAEGVEPLPDRGRPPAEWVWRQPAVTILSTTLPPPGREKNAVRRAASAKLSVRVAPGQAPAELASLIEAELLRDPPGGVKVSVARSRHSSQSWLYTPRGEAFEAANRAYRRSWGHDMLQIGVGGSIPFVALFGRRFGDLPLILNGVMDPATGAHGPNESMHLGVFEKAVVANCYLLAELGALSAEELSTASASGATPGSSARDKG